MKVEIGESLACSWLRHVHQCWLVQTNWKFLESWVPHMTNAELEELFKTMKDRFDRGRGVFKTTNVSQFLKQGEIDVLGIDHEGGVHAVEVAYHESGLHYREPENVLKKMLRTLLILRACRPAGTKLHICFLSPKVNPAVQQPLEKTFAELRSEYPCVDWRFVANDDFTEAVVRPTLEKAIRVADSSELFMRSAKLLNLAGYVASQRLSAQPAHSTSGKIGVETVENTKTKGSMNKQSAMAMVNEHVGSKLLTDNNTNFANINSRKDVWWINVDPAKFVHELHIILAKDGDGGLIWLRIAAGSIPASEDVFRVKKDNGYFDFEISSHPERYLKDVKSGGTEYDFTPHVEYEWD